MTDQQTPKKPEERKQGNRQGNLSVNVGGNVGPGGAIGQDATVRAHIIAGRDGPVRYVACGSRS